MCHSYIMNELMTIPTHILVVNSHGSVKSGDIKYSILDIYDDDFVLTEKLMKEIYDNDTAEVFCGSYEECQENKQFFIDNNVPVYIKEIE